jgi:iron-sulfur cluster repair protein YtfE (RIC family)
MQRVSIRSTKIRRSLFMTALQSIQQGFAEDHDRLDGLLAEYRSLKRADPAAAKERFKEFKFGLQRHIVWEEQILFPLFERKTGLSKTGPTAVMRAEHRQIGERLEAIHQKVRKQDPDSDAEIEALLVVLSSHNQKEEGVLYPALDRLLSAEEVATAFEAMKKVPEEAYKTCCGHHA